MWHDSRILENFLLITWLMGVYIHICICYIQICVWYVLYVLYMWAHNIYYMLTLFYIFISAYRAIRGFPSGSMVKTPPAIRKSQKTQIQSLGWNDPLEKGMGIYAWEIPRDWGAWQATCLQTFRHDWSDLAHRTHSSVSLF